MKVTLNIENDAELRAYIKECIKGQVLSITRDEVFEQVKQELERKIKSISTTQFESIIKESMRYSVEKILREEHSVNSWDTRFIQPYVQAVVFDAVKRVNWDKLIDELAKEKVRNLIK